MNPGERSYARRSDMRCYPSQTRGASLQGKMSLGGGVYGDCVEREQRLELGQPGARFRALARRDRNEGRRRKQERPLPAATEKAGVEERQVFVNGSAVSKSDRAGRQKALEGLRRIPVQIGWAGQTQGRTSRWLSWALGQRGATKGLRAHPVAPTVGRGNTAAYRIVTAAISAGTGIQHQHPCTGGVLESVRRRTVG
ncbi:hypothetical protein VTN00DRAFT_1072 [Thermoascus crustaceus]|uniref:uncharacterized protein n=1 Tax=Thermoascus crustaceus TaxID=5088 RepID=UPI0037433891